MTWTTLKQLLVEFNLLHRSYLCSPSLPRLPECRYACEPHRERRRTVHLATGLVAWKVSLYRRSSLASWGPNREDPIFRAYSAMNQLLSHLVESSRFPNLAHVVVVGHSAGGQIVERYAIVGDLTLREGVVIRYVASARASFAIKSRGMRTQSITNQHHPLRRSDHPPERRAHRLE